VSIVKPSSIQLCIANLVSTPRAHGEHLDRADRDHRY